MKTNKQFWHRFAGIFSAIVLALLIQKHGVHGAIGIPIAFAATDISAGIYTQIGFVNGLIISVLQFMSFIVFHILEKLLDPHIIFDQVTFGTQQSGNGEAMLLAIWKVSRDLVNIIFALLLVAGAIVTVITANSEIIKQYYKKFVLAVVLVNFSWFFPRVILDFANVMTATIYKLPEIADIAQDCKFKRKPDSPPEDCFIATDPLFFTSVKKMQDAGLNVSEYKCPIEGTPDTKAPDKTLIYCHKEILLKNANNVTSSMTIIHGLVMGHAGLPFLAQVIKDEPGPTDAAITKESFPEIFNFLIRGMFVVILYIMLFFPLAAMTVAFIWRIIVLWITIAFMPFMFVGFVIGDKMGNFNSMDKIFKTFLKSAFLPTVVAIPLAVGFIMINMATQMQNIPTTMNIPGNIIPTASTLWEMLWLFASFGIIWKGFFSAMKIDATYEKIGGFFENIGTKWGKFALQAPLAIPLPIMPGAGGGSTPLIPLSGLATALRDPTILLRDGKLDKNDLTGIATNFRGESRDPSGVEKTVSKIHNEFKTNVEQHITNMQDPNVSAAGKEKASKEWVELTRKKFREENDGAEATRNDILNAMKKNADLVNKQLTAADEQLIEEELNRQNVPN